MVEFVNFPLNKKLPITLKYSVFRYFHINQSNDLYCFSQRGRRRLDVLLWQLQVRVQGFDPLGHGRDLTVDAFELRSHDVVKLVLDDVELHHRVAAEHRGPECQTGIVGAPIGSNA